VAGLGGGSGTIAQLAAEEMEIGRILQLKTENRNLKLDGPLLKFLFSVLNCRFVRFPFSF
jgi:hypothetical protein